MVGPRTLAERPKSLYAEGMADKKHPFGLKHDPRSRKEKRGAGAAVPGAAAASGAPASGLFDSGAAALSTLGRMSPGGTAPVGLWESLVGGLSKATGLSAVAASKAVVVALVVGASSMAAGVSLYIGRDSSGSGPLVGARVFVDPSQDADADTVLRPVARPSAEQTTQAGASLDYLSQANGPAPEPEATPEAASDAPAAVPEVKTAEAPNNNVAMSGPPARTAPKEYRKPPMAKRAMAQTRGETGGKVSLAPLDSLTGKVGAGFQDVYRPSKTGAFDAMSQSRPNYGANRKSAVLRTGSNAMGQARVANRLSKSAQMYGGSAASHMASTPFDGANSAARGLGATRPGGASIGGTGVSSSANSLLDSKSIEPPPAPESKKNENKTPYQGMVMAATAALMIGTVLLMLAGQMAGQAQKSPGPDAAAKLKAAKMLAMAAMAAGGSAAGMGGMLAGQYGQLTQGMPFIMGGGILAVQAGMVLAKAEKAGQDGQAGVANAGEQALGQSAGALQSAMGPAMQAMNGGDSGSSSSDKPKPAPKPQGHTFSSDQYTHKGKLPDF